MDQTRLNVGETDFVDRCDSKNPRKSAFYCVTHHPIKEGDSGS